MPDASPTRLAVDNVRGVLFMLLAAAMFATAAALAKVAVETYHVLQILFFRQLVVLASALPSIAQSLPGSLKTQHIGGHLVRLTGAFIALSCSIWAVALLPLTTAVTLSFVQVFFGALLAVLLLGEGLGRYRLGAIFVGFIGVVVVMRPGVGDLTTIYALVPLTGALGAAVAKISVRRLSQVDSTATLLTYQALFVGVLSGLPMNWLWTTPDATGLILLICMGALAAAGQWFGVKALQVGEMGVVGNMEYTSLIYAGILGYLLFAEVPDLFTLVGAAIIVGSALFIFHRERRLQAGA